MVKLLASALISRGVSERCGVSVLGYNHPVWVIAYHAAIFANCINCGIYITNEPDACRYVLENSDSEAILVENNMQMDKILQVWHNLPKLKYLIHWGNDFSREKVPSKYSDKIFTFEEFLDIPRSVELEQKLSARMRAQGPGTCCTYVYTSGTTGNPKGVMLSHDNYIWTGETTIKSNEEMLNSVDGQHRVVSFLPLSHVAAQFADIIMTFMAGACLYFADAKALSGTLPEYLQDVRPTFFVAVPRVWEKMEEKIRAALEEKPTITGWARGVGMVGTDAELKGNYKGVQFWLAQKIVFNKIKKQLG